MILHFVLNPRAGRGGDAALEEALRREFRGREIRISREIPEPGALEGVERIVAAGGDGTVNRLLDVARHSGIPLGILPRGTANDFAAALRIPADFRRACAVLREGRVLAVDLASVNGVPFATCGGLGLAAEAAARADRWRGGRRIPGAWVYALAALRTIGRLPRLPRVRIRNGPRVETGPVAAILVSNQARFGRRFVASPGASNRDGLLDLCRIDATASRARLLWIALRMLGGGPGEGRGVSQQRGRSFTLRCDRRTDFFGDGEILATGRRFLVRVLPGALRVVVPGESRGR